MNKSERKLQQISGSLLVSLPAEWTGKYGLKKGSKVNIALKEDGSLILAPEIKPHEQRKETVITYDRFFVRRFFKDYLSGTDFIKILFREKASQAEKKRLYDFIQNYLMNVQIIEESSERIVLQNFRLEGISIKSCFQRMHYIVSNMFEDILNNEMSGIGEKEKSLTKFYYMAVRLIRQYLQEGGYSKEGEISLVMAMDFRLACEKIERIADSLKAVSQASMDDSVRSFGSKVYDEYKLMIPAFINEDFKLAISMWNRFSGLKKEGTRLEEKFMKKGDYKNVRALQSFLRVLEHVNDIANLVKSTEKK